MKKRCIKHGLMLMHRNLKTIYFDNNRFGNDSWASFNAYVCVIADIHKVLTLQLSNISFQLCQFSIIFYRFFIHSTSKPIFRDEKKTEKNFRIVNFIVTPILVKICDHSHAKKIPNTHVWHSHCISLNLLQLIVNFYIANDKGWL